MPETPEQRLARLMAQGDTPEARLAKIQSSTPPSRIHRLAQQPGGMSRLRAKVADANLADTAEIPTAGEMIGETLETPLAGVPGGALAMSAVQKLSGDRRPFKDIQSAVNRQTSDTDASVFGRAIGSIAATGPIARLSGAAGGAIYGALDEGLSNDPEASLEDRLAHAVGGAVAGGVTGAAADRIVAGARAVAPKWLGGAGNAAKNRATMLTEQARSAKQLYDAALKEGKGKVFPQVLKDFMASPDIAEIATNLKSERAMANVADESPEMLDAIFKKLSDESGVLKSKLGALTPRGANTGRVAAKSVGMAKGAALDAMSDVGPYLGDEAYMPSYAKAVQDFANRAKEIEAFDTGYDALSKASGGGKGTAKNLNRLGKSKDPSTFADWIGGTKSNVRDANLAAKGVIGSVRDEPLGLVRTPKALGNAAKMLRATDEAAGKKVPDMFRRLLMLLGESATAPTVGATAEIIEP